ncbi:hypothetical protein tinsulaeT_16830 [Thalassotalea insulae]|uniref:Cytochrome c domain-containing protein n=1 Tax=Thalassotalea insulae TaxID=2056778 RepID=A0ABQ6GQV4_9GAMM|nr:porin [Thalassotalea insulae]GLX78343.1 hypothetical protein tinsulaeT_16830 [Thalassotalea insulae]
MLQLFNLSLLVALLLIGPKTYAEPLLAYLNNLKCSACHVNPDGGGLRNSFGNAYGYSVLPQKQLGTDSADIGKVSDYLRLGGNFRSNAEYVKDKTDQESATFKVDSAQLYLAFNLKDTITFYLDQKLAPGSAINREAFVMYHFNSNDFVKAGKIYVPFGIRLEDDSALVRQATGFNFASSDNGIELGFEREHSLLNFFVTNGTSAVSNDDNNFLYGLRAEYLFSNARVGTTLTLNDRDEGKRQIVNFYGAYSLGKFTLLTEWDWIESEQTTGGNKEQLVGLFELNYQWMPGLNIKLTSEWYDPDRQISEDQETRYSLVTEYTPLSHIQLRAGIRVMDSIPQFEQRNNDLLFIQTHFYF